MAARIKEVGDFLAGMRNSAKSHDRPVRRRSELATAGDARPQITRIARMKVEMRSSITNRGGNRQTAENRTAL
jgi:hypothetical protein